ncbi:MAG: hypothetical protein IJC93_00320, partial [Clostridia bacterium]|nr:hypothetical protein [Clostridia bacterium]
MPTLFSAILRWSGNIKVSLLIPTGEGRLDTLSKKVPSLISSRTYVLVGCNLGEGKFCYTPKKHKVAALKRRLLFKYETLCYLLPVPAPVSVITELKRNEVGKGRGNVVRAFFGIACEQIHIV